MEQGHCLHLSPPRAAAEPLMQGCGEPSQGPSVPLGSFELPTEQTVIRKWGDQQQHRDVCIQSTGSPGEPSTQICLLSVSSWDVLRGSSTNMSAGPLFEFCGNGKLGRLGSRSGRPTPHWNGSRGCWDPRWLLQVSSYRVGRIGRINAFI